MSAADDFANDAADLIAEFGEEIEYRPAGGPPRTVIALVRRQMPERPPIGSGDPKSVIDLMLSSDPTRPIIGGIDPTVVNWNSDTVGVSYWQDGSLQEFMLQRNQLRHQSHGRWTIRVK